MNKSDKYYLKQGKLELSMLEDEEDELELKNSIQRPAKKDLFVDVEFPHSKRLRDNSLKTSRSKEPKLKVTQDIYNTLHTMGQFLAKSDEGEIESVKVVSPKRSINAAKAQKLEQIASTLKIQEIELPPKTVEKNETVEQGSELSKKEEMPFESLSGERLKEKITVGIPKQEQLREEILETAEILRDEINAEINELLAEEKELETCSQSSMQEEEGQPFKDSVQIEEVIQEEVIQEEVIQEEVIQEEVIQEEIVQEEIVQEEIVQEEIVQEVKNETLEGVFHNEVERSAIEREIEQVYPSENDLVDKEKKDRVVAENAKDLKQNHIDEIIKSFFGKSTHQYPFAKQLKKHIDKQIASIENYE